MRPLLKREKQRLYRVAKTASIAIGAVLIVYGGWFLVSALMMNSWQASSLFGIFPTYVGGMMILFALAMKEEWFTDLRQFW